MKALIDITYKLGNNNCLYRCCVKFGTRDKYAQTDRIGGSGTFYLELSIFINVIKYKRVKYEYSIGYKSFVCVK